MMSRSSVLVTTCVAFALIVMGAPARCQAMQDEVAPEVDEAGASSVDAEIMFSRMAGNQVRTELLHWLAGSGAKPDVLEEVTREWADDEALAGMSGEELLDQLIRSFAKADPAAASLLEASYGSGPLGSLVFDGIRAAELYRHQVTLFQARWLVQHRYYDDALPLLERLDPDQVVDPAGLLFYRAVCESSLLQTGKAQDSLSLLLNNTLDVPDRFRTVAEMLKQDLEGRADDGMQKVADLMQDVERRLDLGRSGEKTQEQEGAVIAALDKLLEELEKQNQQQQGGGGSGSQQNQAGQQGADQSQIKGAPAEGIADRKNVDEQGKWGMLDQQEEANVRELIRGRFPSNFLDQIGRYTRKLAEKQN